MVSYMSETGRFAERLAAAGAAARELGGRERDGETGRWRGWPRAGGGDPPVPQNLLGSAVGRPEGRRLSRAG